MNGFFIAFSASALKFQIVHHTDELSNAVNVEGAPL